MELPLFSCSLKETSGDKDGTNSLTEYGIMEEKEERGFLFMIGMSAEASEARRLYKRKYRQRNKEKIYKQQREWRARNPDKVRGYNVRYWERAAQRTGGCDK